MKDLISVIVPVYNVESYLNRCIESLVRQTYKYLEIILVDDGSLDGCPHICDKWSERDNRIHVIHKTNGGLSSARNAGLKVAKGEYIAFLDSDDWIHTKFIEHLYITIKDYKVDIAACDICQVYTEKQDEKINKLSVKIYSTEEALETLINGETFRAVAWNKLYHKNMLIGEQFETRRYHEDEFFTYRIMAKTNKLAYVDEKLYYYFQRKGSIMNSISYKHLDALDAYLERIAYFKDLYPKLYKIDKMRFCIACIYFYQETFKLNDKEKRECKNRIKSSRHSIRFNCSELKQYSLKESISIVGSRVCIGLLSQLMSLKRNKLK